ncbi:MAG: ribosome maturation factor RimM, partial [Pyrinomonadaceae bacterium]
DIESYWFQSGRVILKLADYDSIDAAEQLIGAEFVVSEENCVTLGENEFYEWQLIGCRVMTTDGNPVGIVRRIWQTGAAPILIIENEGDTKHERMVPLTGSICVEVDTTARLIRIDAPEGLLDW